MTWRTRGRYATCKACGVGELSGVRRSDGRRVLYRARKDYAGNVESLPEVHECVGGGGKYGAPKLCAYCGKARVHLVHGADGYRLMEDDGTPHKGRCLAGRPDASSTSIVLDALDPVPATLPITEPAAPITEPKPAPPTDSGLRAIAAALAPALEPLLALKADRDDVANLVRSAVAEALGNNAAPRVVHVRVTSDDRQPVDVGQAHCLLPRLINAIIRHRHVFVYGAPGAGKSFAARQAATALGRGMAYISLSPATPEWRLTGYLDATGTYRTTTWRQAVERGDVFCLDEADNSSASALIALNETLANGWAAFPDGETRVSDLFAVVACGNTLGRGGQRGHETRQTLDFSTLDRFALLEWTYDDGLETAMLVDACPHLEAESARALQCWARGARETWRSLSTDPCPVTPRMMVRLAKALAAGDSWTDAYAEAGAARLGAHRDKMPAAPQIEVLR